MEPCSRSGLRLHVIIAGGGIAGLAAAFSLGKSGHKITLVEQNTLSEAVGAGIQLSPNVSRLLIRWGLKGRLDSEGVRPVAASFNRYSNDEEIGYTPIGGGLESEYGAPYYHVHRADLIQMLYDLAKNYTAFIKAKVVGVIPDAHQPSIVLESGERIAGDLVLGADGIKSVVRKCMVNEIDGVVPAGDIAYRTTIPATKLMADSTLSSLLLEPKTICWMGPGRHIVGYFVRNKQVYNLVIITPGTDAEESWTAQASRSEVAQTFSGWNPRVSKLIDLIEDVRKWKLVLRPPLKTWIDESGRIGLIGDSCHAMLPYFAQGAAMAIEDAAVLGRLFATVTNSSEIPALLKAYEHLRLARASRTQEASYANRGRFHLPDGPQQQARDASMRAARLAALGHNQAAQADNINLDDAVGNNKRLALVQFGYDAEAEAEKWLKDNYYESEDGHYKL